jgi:hypothetical protein
MMVPIFWTGSSVSSVNLVTANPVNNKAAVSIYSRLLCCYNNWLVDGYACRLLKMPNSSPRISASPRNLPMAE